MKDMALLIMEKNSETGFLEKELGSYSIEHDEKLVERIFALRDGGEMVVHLYATVPGEFEDWEYNAIMDNYDGELYGKEIISLEEDEESYNPTWLIKFKFEEEDTAMERKLNRILKIHEEEVKRVLRLLKDLEEEYKA